VSTYLGDILSKESKIVFSLPVLLLLSSTPSLLGSRVLIVPCYRNCSLCWYDLWLAPFPQQVVVVHWAADASSLSVDYVIDFPFSDVVPGFPFDVGDGVAVMAVEEVAVVVVVGGGGGGCCCSWVSGRLVSALSW
jgi:hypothetical protein